MGFDKIVTLNDINKLDIKSTNKENLVSVSAKQQIIIVSFRPPEEI